MFNGSEQQHGPAPSPPQHEARPSTPPAHRGRPPASTQRPAGTPLGLSAAFAPPPTHPAAGPPLGPEQAAHRARPPPSEASAASRCGRGGPRAHPHPRGRLRDGGGRAGRCEAPRRPRRPRSRERARSRQGAPPPHTQP